MEDVVRDPRWAGVLLLTFAVMAAARVGVTSTQVGKLAVTDQWVRRMEAFGVTVDDDRYATLERLGERAWQLGAVTSIATGLVLPVGLAAALALVFGRSAVHPSFQQALGVTTHASTILMIRELVSAPVSYVRESIASPLTLGTFFPMLDAGSAAAQFLSMVDLFIVWWLVVLAIGTGVLYHRSARSLSTFYLTAYLAFALVVAAVMALTGGAA